MISIDRLYFWRYKMKSYLAVCNAGQLLKIEFTNDVAAPKGTISTNFDGLEPIETFNVPGGKCNLYNLNGTWVYATDNMAIEVGDNDILAQYNFNFSDEYIDEDFGYTVQIVACYIMGYVIGRSEDMYRKLIIPFIEKILYNNGRSSQMNFEEYTAFNNIEETFGIHDHIKIFDVMLARSVNAYTERNSGLEFTIMDTTNCRNIFNSKGVFFI